MNIDFTVKTNRPYCLINTAKFKLKNGSVITNDANLLELEIEDDADSDYSVTKVSYSL
jgi:hypothetical protein